MRLDAASARRLLAGVRLVNGTVALVAPGLMLRRLGTDPDEDPSGVYPLRMFGVRTVLLASDLVLLRGDARRRATRVGVLVHASDTVAAVRGGLSGQLPRRVALLTTTISAVNTALAVVAATGGEDQPGEEDGRPARPQ